MKKPIPKKWLDLFALIPGYDPVATAGDCWFDAAVADTVIRFFSTMLQHIEGELAGTPLIPQPWQAAHLGCAFGWKRPDGRRRYREVFDYEPRKNGKALDVDTPIPTPGGWKRMGDLNVGDVVFDEHGSPCRVTEAHPVMLGHRCFKVGFSDGTSIVADEEHLWTIADRWRDNRQITITTAEVLKTYRIGNRVSHQERRYSLPKTKPLQLPDLELPIDPYVLGVWLGDGTTDCANVTNSVDDNEILENIRAGGVTATIVRKDRRSKAVTAILGRVGRGSLRSFQTKLRMAGLLHNKHIPEGYLRSSVPQRLKLLQGLMDTDGYVSKAGQCEFVSTSKLLFDGALELIRTLGFKPTVMVDRARFYGKDCGPRYRAQFWSFRDKPAFLLSRKAKRLKEFLGSRSRSSTKQIVLVEEVESVPVRCIRVNSPSSLFLAGAGFIPTHNTTKLGGLINFVAFCDNEPGAQIYSAASEREQAALVYRQAKGMIVANPQLEAETKIYTAFKSIEYPGGVTYKALSAEADTKHGFNTHVVVVDELHAQPNRDLVDVLVTSTGSRRQPLIWYITTADFNRPSICNEKYDYACKVRDGIIEDLSFLPIIYEAKPEDAWDDPETWKRANPNLGVSISLDYLERECQRAKEITAYENTFRRLHLNQRTETDVRAIPMDRWDACGLVASGKMADAKFWREDAIERLSKENCWAGIDLGSTADLTALVLAFRERSEADEEEVTILPYFWVPRESARQRSRRDRVPYDAWLKEGWIKPTEGNVTDYDTVRRDINELAEKFSIRAVEVDRLFQGAQLCTQLQGDGFAVEAFGQGFYSMAAPTKRFLELITDGKLRHGNNPVLRWMASNLSTEMDAAGNLKPSKKKSTEKIDGCVSAIMAIGKMMTEPENSGDFYLSHGIEFC